MTNFEQLLKYIKSGKQQDIENAIKLVKEMQEDEFDENVLDLTLDQSPIHSACFKGQKDLVEAMIDKAPILINCLNIPGESPITAAVMGNKIEIIQLLLDHKANINAKGEYGAPPLYAAAMSNHHNIIELLIKYKANMELTNGAKNKTALYIASYNGDKATVDLLLQYGADIRKMNGSQRLNSSKQAAELADYLLANLRDEPDQGTMPDISALTNEDYSLVTKRFHMSHKRKPVNYEAKLNERFKELLPHDLVSSLTSFSKLSDSPEEIKDYTTVQNITDSVKELDLLGEQQYSKDEE